MFIAPAVFIAICTAMNYRLDFENSVLDAGFGSPLCIVKYFLFYAFSYYTPLFIIGIRKQHLVFFKQSRFWIFSLFLLAVLAFDGGSAYHRVISSWFETPMQYFVSKLVNQLSNVYTTLIPLVLFYFLIDRKKSSFYGLFKSSGTIKPYFILLACMVPVVALASFHESFISYYPVYKNGGFSAYTGFPGWLCALVYELSYGWDFISVELVFRGLMVIGMAGILGRDALFAMVCTYAFLHFGKPLGETISSVFGGFILGVIAYYSRSIMGGVIIHIGVAWMMEFFASLQKNIL